MVVEARCQVGLEPRRAGRRQTTPDLDCFPDGLQRRRPIARIPQTVRQVVEVRCQNGLELRRVGSRETTPDLDRFPDGLQRHRVPSYCAIVVRQIVEVMRFGFFTRRVRDEVLARLDDGPLNAWCRFQQRNLVDFVEDGKSGFGNRAIDEAFQPLAEHAAIVRAHAEHGFGVMHQALDRRQCAFSWDHS